MEKALKNYKILFLIGAAASFLLYEFRESGKADIALLLTSLVTGYNLMTWVESKQKEDKKQIEESLEKFNNRLDEVENKLQVQSENLSNATEIGKRMLRVEARMEVIKEKINEKNK